MRSNDKQTALEGPVTRAELPAYAETPWDRADWQRLWLGVQRHPWRTLAVVAGDRRLSTYEVASLIAALGRQHGEPIGVADVRDVSPSRASAVIELVSEMVAGGERVVFATRSVDDNLATIPIARFADRVLLCVSLGSTCLELVEQTVALVGKERFLGSLLLEAPPLPAPTRAPSPGSVAVAS